MSLSVLILEWRSKGLVCVVGCGLTSGSSWSFGMQAGSTHLTGLFSVEQLLQQQQPQQHRASA